MKMQMHGKTAGYNHHPYGTEAPRKGDVKLRWPNRTPKASEYAEAEAKLKATAIRGLF